MNESLHGSSSANSCRRTLQLWVYLCMPLLFSPSSTFVPKTWWHSCLRKLGTNLFFSPWLWRTRPWKEYKLYGKWSGAAKCGEVVPSGFKEMIWSPWLITTFFERTRNENDGMPLCWFWTRLGMWCIFSLLCRMVVGFVAVTGLLVMRWEQLPQYTTEMLFLPPGEGCLSGKHHSSAFVSPGAMDARLCSSAAPQRGTPSAEWVKETLMNLILHGWLVGWFFGFFFALWKSPQLKYKPP